MKKSIHFKKRFEIKCFKQEEASDGVHRRKSFMELYKAKEDNKPKPLTKAKRNS